MKTRSFVIVALLFASITSRAQIILRGVVTESGKNTKLENVFIREVGSKHVGLTDRSGTYTIQTAVNHTLIFSLPGYVADTLFIVDAKPKNVELRLQGITLGSVDVSSTVGPFDPEKEYPEIYEKSKFALSPSRIFGKESRDARRLKHYFQTEAEQRQIDAIFTKTLVSSIVPLKGHDLDNFMSMYRPTLAFAKNSSQQTLTIYINDSYKKFIALPPDKRGLQPLNGGN